MPNARVSYDDDEDKLGNSPHPWNDLAHAAATIIKFLPTVIFGRYKIGTEAPSFYIYAGDNLQLSFPVAGRARSKHYDRCVRMEEGPLREMDDHKWLISLRSNRPCSKTEMRPRIQKKRASIKLVPRRVFQICSSIYKI